MWPSRGTVAACAGPKLRSGSIVRHDNGEVKSFSFDLTRDMHSCPASVIKVLLVEDDDFQRQSMDSMFQQANARRPLYELSMVASADEVRRIAHPTK